jgi:hypothetical protein
LALEFLADVALEELAESRSIALRDFVFLLSANKPDFALGWIMVVSVYKLS